jgi:hypothetical protein
MHDDLVRVECTQCARLAAILTCRCMGCIHGDTPLECQCGEWT